MALGAGKYEKLLAYWRGLLMRSHDHDTTAHVVAPAGYRGFVEAARRGGALVAGL
jgi:hypothetical protein